MTYLVGKRDPDDYVRLHKDGYGAAKDLEFYRKVAEAEDGTLFLATNTSPGARYTINHGGQLVTISHVKRDGKWVSYAKGEETNLVIRVKTGDSPWSVYHLIESRLMQTKLGRAVGHEPLHEMSRMILEMLGLDDYDSWTASEEYATLDVDDNARARKALKELLEFAPEGGYYPEIGELGAKVDGVGYAEDAKGYDDLINGASDGFGGDLPKERLGRPLPMLSEPVYYAVAGGKGGGRSFRARLHELKDAIGYEDEED